MVEFEPGARCIGSSWRRGAYAGLASEIVMSERATDVAGAETVRHPRSGGASIERLKQLAGVIVTRTPVPFTRPLESEDHGAEHRARD